MITADLLLRYHRLRFSLDPRRRGVRPASRISDFRVADEGTAGNRFRWPAARADLLMRCRRYALIGCTLKTLALEFCDLCFGFIQFQLELYPLAIRLSEFRGETCGFLFQVVDLHFYLIG